MKKTFIVAVGICAAAVALSGCKYSKTKGGASGASDTASEIDSGKTDIDSVIDDIKDSDDAIVTARPFSEYLKPVEGVSFDPVYFKFDSTAVPEAEKSKIESVYKDLAENDSHVVVVEGHCDERGANDYNMSLGENRSGIIRDYLVRLGVNAERIQTKSWGEEKPAVAGSNETAWAKNRRAEFSLFQK